MRKAYIAPAIRELGSLQELTRQSFNKVGNSADAYSQETNNQVVGSVVPAA
jgi:hypothetical protein